MISATMTLLILLMTADVEPPPFTHIPTGHLVRTDGQILENFSALAATNVNVACKISGWGENINQLSIAFGLPSGVTNTIQRTNMLTKLFDEDFVFDGFTVPPGGQIEIEASADSRRNNKFRWINNRLFLTGPGRVTLPTNTYAGRIVVNKQPAAPQTQSDSVLTYQFGNDGNQVLDIDHIVLGWAGGPLAVDESYTSNLLEEPHHFDNFGAGWHLPPGDSLQIPLPFRLPHRSVMIADVTGTGSVDHHQPIHFVQQHEEDARCTGIVSANGTTMGNAMFAASLAATQEVPPVGTAGGGVGCFTLTPEGLEYWVTVDGLTGPITAAHIHVGDIGIAGPVKFPLSFASGTLRGLIPSSSLTATDVVSLLNGQFYVNVHTAANPAGEVRGQIFAGGEFGFSAILTGAQMVPPTGSPGGATAALTWTSSGLQFSLTGSGLSSPVIAAHFHNASAGVNGPAVRDIFPNMSGNTGRGVWPTEDAQPLTLFLLQELLAGRIYLSLKTAAFPGGEIRGQVQPNLTGTSPAATFSARLSASAEVPPNGSNGLGNATFQLTASGLAFWITVDGLSGSVTAAHFHSGAIGVGGGVVMTLSFNGNTASGLWIPSGPAPFTQSLKEQLLKGQLYVDVHTAAMPGGEIRGQIVPASGGGFEARLTARQETPPIQGPSAAVCMARLQADGLIYQLSAEGLDGVITSMNIRRGAVGETGPMVFDAIVSPNAHTASGVWPASGNMPLTADLIRELAAGRLYVEVCTNGFPDGAMRGQLRLADGIQMGMLLHGGAVVPPTSTIAVGSATFTLTGTGVVFEMATPGLGEAITSADVREAPAGTTGPVVRSVLAEFAGGDWAAGLWHGRDSQPLTSRLVDALLSQGLYVNIGTPGHTVGAQRGQVTYCPATDLGACCVATTCMVATASECAAFHGNYQGDGVPCGDCSAPRGACCFVDGSCEALTEIACRSTGGSYEGDETVCLPNPCSHRIGACCSTYGACSVLTESECLATGGIQWLGPGSVCEANPCSPCPASGSSVVSHYQKISDTQGGFGGLTNENHFGHSLVRVGDLDGDGVGDIAAGADGVREGSVYVLFLNRNGTVKSQNKIDWTDIPPSCGTLHIGDHFGTGVAWLGDLDGAGMSVGAIAVGAPFDDDSGQDRGAVWVLFLDAGGNVLRCQKISASQGGFAGHLDNDDWFGSSVTSLGDLNGDGVADLGVGAMLDDDGGPDGSNRGAAWVLFLHSDGTVRSEQKISATEGNFGGSLIPGSGFGNSMAALGLTSGGPRQLVIGALADDDGGCCDRGAVWELTLNPDGRVQSYQKISAVQGGLGLFTLDPGDYFGSSVASVGDWDEDGIEDLVVGADGDDDGGRESGAIWLLRRNADGTVKCPQKISSAAGGFGGDLDSLDYFGVSVTSLGDLDGNGGPDLAVGAAFDDDGGLNRGAVWVLSIPYPLSSVEESPADVPGPQAMLAQPNPFMESVQFRAPTGTGVIEIFDAAGRLVRRLAVRSSTGAGVAFVSWDGRSDSKAKVPAGVYFARWVGGGRSTTATLIRAR